MDEEIEQPWTTTYEDCLSRVNNNITWGETEMAKVFAIMAINHSIRDLTDAIRGVQRP